MAKRRRGKLAFIIPWFKRFGVILGVFIVTLWLGAWVWVSGLAQGAANLSEDAAMMLSARSGFRVENILVVNRKKSDPAALKAVLSIEKGDPLFSFDPRAAKKQIEKINWVYKAQVERRWPDTIYIRLEEREPVALWQQNKKLLLIDKEGHVIGDENIKSFSNLIIVMGEGAPAHIEELFSSFAEDSPLFKRISSAKWVGDRRWDLQLYNTITVKLPEADIRTAVRFLEETDQKDQILDKDVRVIDLRESGRMSVEPSSGRVVNYKNAIDKARMEGNNI